MLDGTTQVANGVALQAKNDLVTAYNDAAGRSSTATVAADLAGETLTPGVYTSASSLGLSGQLTLDAQGNPNAVFIFQAGSSLIVGSGSQVNLIGGAQACNVFWQVGSSATIGTSSAFVGNILALTSITMTTGATLQGSALARNGAVTLDTNTITQRHVRGGHPRPRPRPRDSGDLERNLRQRHPGRSAAAPPRAPPARAARPGRHADEADGHEAEDQEAEDAEAGQAVGGQAPKPKPVTPKPVIPTAAKPPAFTG